MFASVKRTSLLRLGISYIPKKFYNDGPCFENILISKL